MDDVRISAVLQEAQKQFGIGKDARCYISPKLTSPISVGFRSTSVIFPVGLYRDMDGSELRAILLHELAHIYHRDHNYVGPRYDGV
jgi:bla regulator protein BlaR1